MIRHLSAGALALALVLTIAPDSVESAPNGRVVTGTVKLPPRAQRRPAPQRGQGFVPRAKNPLRPPDGLDPRRSMVVFLEGGPVDDMDKKPQSSRYSIVGENFDSEILPVIVGGKVEIKNMGRGTPRLYSKSNPDVMPVDPINPKGVRVTEAITKAHVPVDIRDKDSVHFLAHIVAFQHGYFSTLGHDGTFTIKGVPAGSWKVKLWYQDGWVTNIPDTSVTIAGKRDPKAIEVALPAKLAAPGEAQ
ncbi:MAG: hypothetical protein GY811_20845 [Myxococcales bacterium]|nr:hypothetical protein [Myxococcales bacterium]